MLARDRRHGCLQYAVNPVLDHQRVVVGFYVDVGGAPLQRGEDGGIDQPDDGADVFFRGELLDRDVLVGVVFRGEDVEGETLGGLVEDALGLLGFLEQVGNLRKGGHTGDDSLPQQAADLVQHHEAAGIADRDHQAVFELLQGHEVITEHHVDGHAAEQFVLDTKVPEIDELTPIAVGDRLGAPRFVGFRDCRSDKDGAFGHAKLLLTNPVMN